MKNLFIFNKLGVYLMLVTILTSCANKPPVLISECTQEGEILYYNRSPFTGTVFDVYEANQGNGPKRSSKRWNGVPLNLKHEQIYKKGKKNGEYKRWYVTGQLMEQAIFENNKIVGVPKYWDDNGILVLQKYFKIGQNYGGGIIYYIDRTGRHGLVAAYNDQFSNDIWWGCTGTYISGTFSEIGTGQANTKAIVKGCKESGIAARICDELEMDGYNDWFLPSIDELNKMYERKDVIGGFVHDCYWSSTEYTKGHAWDQHFDDGIKNCMAEKGQTCGVRAIRVF